MESINVVNNNENQKFLREKGLWTFKSLISKIQFFNKYNFETKDQAYTYMSSLKNTKLNLIINKNESTNSSLVFNLNLVDNDNYIDIQKTNNIPIDFDKITKIVIKNKKKTFMIDLECDKYIKKYLNNEILIQSHNINNVNNWILHSALQKKGEVSKFIEVASLSFAQKNFKKIQELYVKQEINPSVCTKVLEYIEFIFNSKKQVLINTPLSMKGESCEIILPFILKNYFTNIYNLNYSLEDNKQDKFLQINNPWNTKENILCLRLMDKLIRAGHKESKFNDILNQLIGYENKYLKMDDVDFKSYNFNINYFKGANPHLNGFYNYISKPRYSDDFDIFDTNIMVFNLSINKLLKISKEKHSLTYYNLLLKEVLKECKDLNLLKDYDVKDDTYSSNPSLIVRYILSDNPHATEKNFKLLLDRSLKKILAKDKEYIKTPFVRDTYLSWILEQSDHKKIDAPIKKKL